MKYGHLLAMLMCFMLLSQVASGQGMSLTFSTVFPNCNGAANGSATVQANGGTAPYTYKWNNGQLTQTAVGLTAGTYTVTVTATGGLSATGSVTLQQPPAVLVSIQRTGFNCNTHGTLKALASGGNGGPYTYNWSNGMNTQSINVEASGTYSVTASDGAGCTVVGSTIVIPKLIADVQTTSVSCYNGPANGSAMAFGTGGTPPYSYSWNTGANTKSIQNLGQDTYTVTITDANNCTATDFGLVSKPSQIFVTVTVNQASCNGSNGSATVSPVGGTPPYTVIWKSLNNAVGATQTNLAPGPYLVSVFDANGCEKEVTVKVPGQGGINVQLAITKAECTGVNNGSVTAIVSPAGNYSYNWNVAPANHTPQLTGLAANTQITVTVTDTNNGCSATASGVVGVHHEIKLDLTTTDIACLDDKNGTASAVASLGVAPYNYTWNYNNAFYANGPNLTNLAAGNYPVTATDAHGCIAKGSATIKALSAPIAAFQLSTLDCINGQINIQFLNQSSDPLGSLVSWVWTITPTGGTPIVLNGQNPANMLFPEGQTGVATLEVISANGCKAQLTKPYKIVAAPTVDVAIQGNAFSCDAQPVIIKVTGNPVYTYSWSPTQGLNLNNAPFTVIANPSVTTQYILTTKYGQCAQAYDTVTIKRAVPLNLQLNSDSIVTCKATALLQASTNPLANATYQWFNGVNLIGTGASITVPASAGKTVYTVVATDEFGCSNSKKVSVTGIGITGVSVELTQN
ncbi:MAG: hypothetical protein KGS48_12915, partial [Bacteroidetes bacterium]|nr:hypothetical protein [Bacteroidota bacterium]